MRNHQAKFVRDSVAADVGRLHLPKRQSGRFLFLLSVFCFLLSLAGACAATTRYVDVNNAFPSWPYTSWDSAATIIQDAVDAADPSDEIVVTNGIYADGGRTVGTNLLSNRVAVDKPLTVRSVNGPEFTVIQGYQLPGTTNGDGAIRCVYLANGSSLSGFTLTNGATRTTGGASPAYHDMSGGGVYCESTNVVVTNCVLAGNSARYQGGGACLGTLNNCTLAGNSAKDYGAGAFGSTLNDCTLVGNSGPPAFLLGGGAAGGYSSMPCLLNRCTLSGNSAGDGGGAAYATLNNCLIISNRAGPYGGGTYESALNNCVVTGNSASEGGGANGGTLNNCTITGNSAGYGGGAYGGTLNNCTLTGNSAWAGGGACACTLNNCIVYYNAAPAFANYTKGSFKYCCTTPLPLGGIGNLEAEPQLASAFRLSASSPCLGKGSYASVRGTDIDSEPWANPPAIGCDQCYSGSLTGALTVVISASYTNVAVGFSVDFQALISGRVSDSRWEFGDGTGLSNRPYASHAWSAAGDYLVVLRAYNNSNPGGVAATVTVHVVAQPVHYVALGSTAPAPPYSSWATAATNIQNAVDASSVVGALVLVSNGVYATGGRAAGADVLANRVAVTKPLAVRSVNGPQFTVIQGYQLPGTTNGDGAIRCVYLTNGANLSGFTLTNGATRTSGSRDQDGGGLWCEPAAVASNCVLVCNSAAKYGGGAYGGTLHHCTLMNNRAPYGGGALYGTLNHCTLSGNSASSGGGGVDACVLNDCTLTGNSVTNRTGVTVYGGGADGSLLNHCTLISNSCSYYGGGASDSTLHNCTLTGNSAGRRGGGTDRCTLYNCTVRGNSAGRGGGVLGGTLYNCTLTGNSATNNGGAVCDGVTLNNCTLIGNSAGSASGGVATGFDYYGSYPCMLTNCIVYSNTAPSSANYDSTNVLNYCCTTPRPATGVGNITSAPLFVDYSGGNLRLQSNSPGINAGNNSYVTTSTDLDGRPRIVGAKVDMGAYEFQAPGMGEFIGWLQQFGLPCNGSADYVDCDADGHNNWQEWRCGTCPTNAASVLKLQTPVPTPPGLLVRWSSDSSHTYGVERATSLTPPVAFSLLQSNLPGLSPTTAFTDTSAPLAGRGLLPRPCRLHERFCASGAPGAGVCAGEHDAALEQRHQPHLRPGAFHQPFGVAGLRAGAKQHHRPGGHDQLHRHQRPWPRTFLLPREGGGLSRANNSPFLPGTRGV